MDAKEALGTCDRCKHWKGNVGNGYPETARSCEHPKMERGYSRRGPQHADGAEVENDEGFGIVTGPKFGCVLHEPI